MAIEATYRSIRSAARKLARRDSLEVIWAYSQFLQVNDFEIPGDIQVSQQFLDANPKQSILAEWSLGRDASLAQAKARGSPDPAFDRRGNVEGPCKRTVLI